MAFVKIELTSVFIPKGLSNGVDATFRPHSFHAATEKPWSSTVAATCTQSWSGMRDITREDELFLQRGKELFNSSRPSVPSEPSPGRGLGACSQGRVCLLPSHPPTLPIQGLDGLRWPAGPRNSQRFLCNHSDRIEWKKVVGMSNTSGKTHKISLFGQ